MSDEQMKRYYETHPLPPGPVDVPGHAEQEYDLAEVLADITRRLDRLEAKFTTTQGINELAHAIELRIVAKMRNTYGRDV